MTLLSGALIWLFRRWPGKRRGAVAAALGIAAYTLLVGASAAVVQAAILSGLTLLARQFGHRQEVILSAAASPF